MGGNGIGDRGDVESVVLGSDNVTFEVGKDGDWRRRVLVRVLGEMWKE